MERYMMERYTEVLKVRITPSQLTSLEVAAASEDANVSEIVRDAIEMYLAQVQPEPAKTETPASDN